MESIPQAIDPAAGDGQMSAQLIEIRRAIHAYPELGFQERRTADLIEATLRGWGITQVHRPIPTCVCAHIGRGQGPIIALRADIDGITQDEQNDVPWRSTVPGLMHGCGHDMHATILLGTAQALMGTQLPGTVVLLFQPAEETGPRSGASVLVSDVGWLEEHTPNEMYAFHVWPWLPTGHVGCGSGPVMAAATSLRLTVTGRGGHAGVPHTTVDAIIIAGHLITALQTVVARQVDPADQVVISLGTIRGGSRSSVVAETVEIEGTVRTLTHATREFVKRRVAEVCTQVAAALGGTVDVLLEDDTSPTVNDSACVRHVQTAADTALGSGAFVKQERCHMTTEDFGRFLERVPGAFGFLGCTAPCAVAYPLHSPRFQPDELAIHHGIAVYKHLVGGFFQRVRG